VARLMRCSRSTILRRWTTQANGACGDLRTWVSLTALAAALDRRKRSPSWIVALGDLYLTERTLRRAARRHFGLTLGELEQIAPASAVSLFAVAGGFRCPIRGG
jgi:hypothetical protein